MSELFDDGELDRFEDEDDIYDDDVCDECGEDYEDCECGIEDEAEDEFLPHPYDLEDLGLDDE